MKYYTSKKTLEDKGFSNIVYFEKLLIAEKGKFIIILYKNKIVGFKYDKQNWILLSTYNIYLLKYLKRFEYFLSLNNINYNYKSKDFIQDVIKSSSYLDCEDLL